MTFDRDPFVFGPAFLEWLRVFGSFAGIIFAIATVTALGVYGSAGPVAVMERVRHGLQDFANLSLRRIWAIAWLTFQEAYRRKAFMFFVVFIVLMMFAGWFLDTKLRSDLLIKNYVTFALKTTSWLAIPVVLLLSCWGIPEDIRLRSLHTVVTKPVRRSEVVMGRILGFSVVAVLIVAIMGGVGYQWINRQIPEPFIVVDLPKGLHHLSDLTEYKATDRKLEEIDPAELRGKDLVNYKKLPIAGKVYRSFVEMVCRVPIYGTLAFLDREGQPTDKGVNTGDIWEFRSYIEGGTKAAAIWTFPIDSEADHIKLESRFEAFRTHKGRVGESLQVRYVLVNETKQLRVPLESFQIAEFALNERDVARQISYYDETAKAKKSVDLFKDLIDQGKFTVEVQCMDSGQYLGMARPDMFVRLPDRHFAVGYFKAVLGIGLLAVFVAAIGVMASTFVKGPVATLLTFTVVIVGQEEYREFMLKLITGEQQGGGPVESLYRLIMHMNDTIALDDNFGTKLMKGIDSILVGGLWLLQHLIPDLSSFVMAPYVANGFDVPWSVAMTRCLFMTLGYLIPCLLVGYYSLTLRELEAK